MKMFVVCCFITLALVAALPQSFFLQKVQEEEGESIKIARNCSVSELCLFVMCGWSLRPMARRSSGCQFISLGCSCPTGTFCNRTNEIKPYAKDLLMYKYRCQPTPQ